MIEYILGRAGVVNYFLLTHNSEEFSVPTSRFWRLLAWLGFIKLKELNTEENDLRKKIEEFLQLERRGYL